MMSALNLESIAIRIYKWGEKKPKTQITRIMKDVKLKLAL